MVTSAEIRQRGANRRRKRKSVWKKTDVTMVGFIRFSNFYETFTSTLTIGKSLVSLYFPPPPLSITHKCKTELKKEREKSSGTLAYLGCQ
jgi:hypothetical protein